MADLRLVITPPDPSAQELVVLRVKKMPRPDGVLQCPRCGSRTVLNTENGVTVKDGRRRSGAKIKQDVCADCDARGVFSPMQLLLKPAT